MKTATLLFVFLSSFCAAAQNPTQKQAKEFLDAHINSAIDIAEGSKEYALLSGHKPGEIIIDGKNIYKITAAATVAQYNAGYIYLDAKKLSATEIKALTDDILEQYKNGISFGELAKKYSMDKNPDAGELIFTEGEMVPSFEKAVRDHAVGEVFTVDTPGEGWFHIVKKNENNRTVKIIRADYALYKP